MAQNHRTRRPDPRATLGRRSRHVTARDIELFTAMTGDRNPLHYDEAGAAASRRIRCRRARRRP